MATKESSCKKDLAGEGKQATEEIRECQTRDTYISSQDNLQVSAQGSKEEIKHDNTTGATTVIWGAISCEERKTSETKKE